MYDEANYIYQEFQKNFAEKKEEPLILYGIGKRTGELLERIQEYQIAGLMDGKKKEGTIWDKPILDYQDVLKLKVKTIVVIARPAVIGVIYHRIEGFCTGNGIAVYDVKGNDLSEVYTNQEHDIPYFHQSYDDLKREAEKHEVISFDVFDTLIMRKVLYPADIFAIVEKRKLFSGFADLRIEAERQLCDSGQNPALEEIYIRLRELSGISEAEKNELREMEIAAELEYIVPRERMLEFFNNIKDKKKIYLISDMYLPQKVIGELLKKCGYDGYDGLYVSCEKRTAKCEKLFQMFLEDRKYEGYESCNCLHIGDNEVADIACAEAVGMDTFQIMSAREMLGSSSYGRLLSEELNLMDRMAAGLLCERAFGDPFALYETKGRFKIANTRDFAYMLIAPMIFYFTVWLMQEVRRWECDYILYPSRDAYLIEKLCSEIRGKQADQEFPKGEYFYTSRRAVLAATIWKEADIEHVAGMDFWGSIQGMFQKRFHLTIDSEAKELNADDSEKRKLYLDKYRDEILKQSRKERENYLRYISGTGITEHKKIAFIDFVAAGKVQNGMEKLIPEKELLGVYFLRRQPDKGEIDRELQVKTFFPSKGAFEIDLNVYKYYLFLEMVLTSPEPTFDCIEDDGKISFMEETRTKEHCRAVEEIQKSVLEYAKEFAELCPELLYTQVNRNTPDIILGFLDKEYTSLETDEVTSLVLTDEFLSQTFNLFQV